MSRERKHPAQQSSVRSFRPVWVYVSLALATLGCGNALYALNVSAASSKIAEARELGAEQYAPYEYTMATEHLAKARTEAAEADYGDAVDLSDLAEEYADKAIARSREAHRGAGR